MQQLLWLNRDSEPVVAANVTRSLNGAPHIQQTVINHGRKVILGTKDSGMDKDDFNALKTHSKTKLTEFDLQVEGQTLSVIWDHTQGPAVTGEDPFDQVGGFEMKTNVTLRFLTV
ncbi:hypothetical protein D5018_03970 [Parashewanella curva]|uniref:Uncharacterized protein n=2 Tax=Parashewanella curva TaxID=2338552 RepID=A0A3L8Q078_9GAMM|nr:hypothetical protein D5018_03970 [Parashewanella curva]